MSILSQLLTNLLTPYFSFYGRFLMIGVTATDSNSCMFYFDCVGKFSLWKALWTIILCNVTVTVIKLQCSLLKTCELIFRDHRLR